MIVLAITKSEQTWPPHPPPPFSSSSFFSLLNKGRLFGGSGVVVNSLDFCVALLISLGCFYFWCILFSQWKAVTMNFTLPTLKAFLEARSWDVSGNKQ